MKIKNERRVWQHLYAQLLKPVKKKPTLQVRDRVCLNKKHHTIKKGYLPWWTEEVFTVDRVILGPVNTYKIRKLDDTPLEGTFDEEDLQQVHVDDDGLFRMEKVLKRQRGKSLVKWKGWPDKYNIWVSKRVEKTMMSSFYMTLTSRAN